MPKMEHANEALQKDSGKDWCRGCLATDLSFIGEKDGYRLLRCASCGTTITNPYPGNEELAAYYANYQQTGNYLKKQDRKFKRGLGRVRRMIKSGASGKRFLDIGCSIGAVTAAAASLGLDAYGIDIDEATLRIAQEQYGDKARFEFITVEALAARGDKFDMIYMSEVIEHVNNPEEFVAALSSLLNKGGLLYLTAPDGGHFGVPKNFTDWGMVTPPNHLTYFTRKGITRLLVRHGLIVKKFQLALKPGMKVFAYKTA